MKNDEKQYLFKQHKDRLREDKRDGLENVK